MKYTDIIGNEAIHSLLKRMVDINKISHANLFLGPEGVGKATTAQVFAKSILCRQRVSGEACGACVDCRKVDAGNHPDFHLIDVDSGTIKIEHIRELQNKIYLKPYESNYRVYLINQADRFTIEAANSLLKILEEPPEDTFFILTSHRPFAMLSTILSRCQQFNFQSVEPTMLEEFLVNQEQITQVQARLLALLSGGCPGKALGLYQSEELLNYRNELVEIVTKLVAGNVLDQLKVAESFEKNKERTDITIEFLILWFRDILIWKETQCAELLVNIDYIDEIQHMSLRYSKQKLLDAINSLTHTKRALNANVNLRLALDNLVFKLGTE